ncbi:MAG: SBBP repeat-containing protein [Planctomycetes bacterium]|nr:SBBP repeat-containing protein [Planctomycetota bacterium]
MHTSKIASTLLGTLCFVALVAGNTRGSPQDEKAEALATSQAVASPSLALGFIRNDGQFDERVRFTTTASGLSAGFLTDGFLLYMLRSQVGRPEDAQVLGGGGSGLRVDRAPVEFLFEGASEAVRVEGQGLLDPYVNYFIGRDPSRWATRVPTYAGVRYTGLYSGIDVVVRKPDARIEYDLVLAPKADPALVRVRVHGAESLALDESGGLEIQTGLGVLCQHPPLAFEILPDGSRRPVECFFQVLSPDLFGFRVPAREPGASLVIDPVLDPYDPAYFTYLGGNPTAGGAADMATDIAVKAGKATVTGCTSGTFPLTPYPGAPADGTFGGTCEAFVTRLDAMGTSLRWSTYFGGDDIDVGYGVEVDAAGAVYVAGFTRSQDLDVQAPAPGVPFQQLYAGAGDAFFLKLDASGSDILYASYLGGSEEDTATDLKIDGLGNAFVCGYTDSDSGAPLPFPTTLNVVEPSGGSSSWSGFASKVAADGTSLVYSTFVRAANPIMAAPQTQCIAIALHIDDSNPANVNAFVTGLVQNAEANGIPITTNAFQSAPGGAEDAFLIGLNATATSYVYGSYYGGTGQDIAFDIAPYSDGLALIGRTYSTNLSTVNPYQPTNGGDCDAFVARFKPYSTPSVTFSTYLGGEGQDVGTAIDTDSTGRNLFCIGVTYPFGTNPFPTTGGPLFSGPIGGYDFFFCIFQTYSLVYSTYLGGTATDEAYGLAVDEGGYYIAGLSAGQGFFAALRALFPSLTGYQTVNQGGTAYSTTSSIPEWPVSIENMVQYTDAFVLKLVSP